jgi:hypothetical protein
MQATDFFSRPSRAVNWIATGCAYTFALAVLAALAFLGVEETRGLLLG